MEVDEKNDQFAPPRIVDASLSQTLFSVESIQRFRAARTAEQAAQLNYQELRECVERFMTLIS
jgi:hypothetical protein